jgi:threonine/homoserine/homoserine lactone efflux protein
MIAFAVIAAVVTITPGPDTLLVLRASAAGGRAAGVAAAGGIVTGCLVWAVASVVGLTALLATSQIAFDALRIAGAVYLCWLGARALCFARVARAARKEGGSGQAAGAGVAREGSPEPEGHPDPRFESWPIARALRTGLTTNLLNPKVGAFYLSVLPQFLPADVHPLAGGLALASVHGIEGLLWLSLLAFLVARARGWLTRATVRRRFEQVSGAVLIALGLRLAIDR